MGNTIGGPQQANVQVRATELQPVGAGAAGGTAGARQVQAPAANTSESRLQRSGLATNDQQRQQTKVKTENAALTATRNTARVQASKTYALSFGGPALLARAAGQGLGVGVKAAENHGTTTTPGVTYNALATTASTAVALVGPLIAPAVHGNAGAAATPGNDSQARFVNPETGANAGLPPNASVAFKPFVNHLAVGNSIISAGNTGAQIGAHYLSPGDGATDAVKGTIQFGTSLALLAPGTMAANATVQNVMGAQADQGASLSEPINTGTMPMRTTVGTVVTHKEPIDRGQNGLELGKVKIKAANNQSYTLTVHNFNGAAHITRHSDDTPAEKSTLENLRNGAKTYFAQGDLTKKTVRKVSALVPTLAAQQAYQRSVGPVITATLENQANLPKPVATAVSSGIGGIATAAMLGYDFVPRFERFAGDEDAATAIHQALTPFAGAINASAANRAALAENREQNIDFDGLNKSDMTPYAENKMDMLALLNIGASEQNRGLTPPVSRGSDGGLQINPTAVAAFAELLPDLGSVNPPNDDAADGGGQADDPPAPGVADHVVLDIPQAGQPPAAEGSNVEMQPPGASGGDGSRETRPASTSAAGPSRSDPGTSTSAAPREPAFQHRNEIYE